MDISLTQQLTSFAASLFLGVIIGIIYEVFRTVRSLFGGGTVVVFIQDIVFWVINSFVVYLFFLVFTKGIVRYFVLIGTFIGFIIYLKTVGRFTAFLFRQLFRPIKFLARQWVKLTKYLFNKIFSSKKTKIISENT